VPNSKKICFQSQSASFRWRDELNGNWISEKKNYGPGSKAGKQKISQSTYTF